MILYLDASALVKRYVEEAGSDIVLKAMEVGAVWSMCRVGYVETVRAVSRGGEPADVERVKRDWSHFDVVEVSHGLTEHAARLATSNGLRALDALHLAAALALAPERLIFATWDARLHRAARKQGLRALPTTLS